MNDKTQTKSMAVRTRKQVRRYVHRHSGGVRIVAVFLATVMAFSALSANVSSIVRLLSVNAGVFDSDTNEYFPADLTLYDYYHTINDSRQWFHDFNQALYDYDYDTTDSDTSTYVTGAGDYDSEHQNPNYYPLYLGLQYYNSDADKQSPYFQKNGENARGNESKYKYSLAVNSEAGSNKSAAMIGLVDSTLSGGTKKQDGTVTKSGTVTQSGKELPYFSTAFLDAAYSRSGFSHSTVGTYYTGKKFRFRKHTTADGDDYAGYYVFDSAKDGLIVTDGIGASSTNVGDTNPNLAVYYTAKAGYNQHTDRKGGYGFFPLGDGNYGFGAKFDIKFTMTEDGRTATGKDMKFTFRGDDDVWVFIDNVLVLDIGGAHGAVGAEINFGDATTWVENVKKKGAETNTPGVDTSSYANAQNTVGDNIIPDYSKNILDTLNSLNIYGDPTKQHMLTVFYLERGEFQSNCLITFNFEQADTLTVKNKINAQPVNAALRSAAVTAAQKEGVEYQIANNGGNTGIVGPDDTGDDALLNEKLPLPSDDGGNTTSYTITY